MLDDEKISTFIDSFSFTSHLLKFIKNYYDSLIIGENKLLNKSDFKIFQPFELT